MRRTDLFGNYIYNHSVITTSSVDQRQEGMKIMMREEIKKGKRDMIK